MSFCKSAYLCLAQSVELHDVEAGVPVIGNVLSLFFIDPEQENTSAYKEQDQAYDTESVVSCDNGNHSHQEGAEDGGKFTEHIVEAEELG